MTPSLEVQEENKQGTILQTKILARIFYPLFDEISNFTEALFFSCAILILKDQEKRHKFIFMPSQEK